MRILRTLVFMLAAALAVVLLIAAIRPVVPASPRPADPLLNAGFESGALAPWTLTPGVDARVTSEQAHGGQYALRVDAGGVLFDDVTITPVEPFDHFGFFRPYCAGCALTLALAVFAALLSCRRVLRT